MSWSGLAPYLLLIWGGAALLQLIRLLRASEGVRPALLLRDGVVTATAISLLLIADEARRVGLIPIWGFVVVLAVTGAGLVALLRAPDPR
jgi:hypothetical protein